MRPKPNQSVKRGSRRALSLVAMLLISFASLCLGQTESNHFRIITEEFPPYNYTNSDGAAVGISTEIVREILRRIGHPDNIEIMPWVDGYRLAQEQENIALFSTTRSHFREKLFKWVGPLVPNNLALFARKGSGIAIGSLEEAKQVNAIGVYKDDFGELLLKEKGFTNLDAMIENHLNIPRLLSGEIDLWIANELTAQHLLATAGVTQRIEKVFDVQEDYMFIAFSRNTPEETVQRWQQALDQIKFDGTYAQIFNRWIMFSYTDDLKPPSGHKLMLSQEEKAWIKAHPVIRVASAPDHAPFQFRNKSGSSDGLANDFLDLMAQKLGVTVEYLNPDSWAHSLQLIKAHKADMVAVATKTPDRLEYMDFTTPYVEVPYVIISRSGQGFNSLAELAGRRLVTNQGFAINQLLGQKHPDIELLTAPDVQSQLQMLSTGEADAAVMNLATATHAIDAWKIANLHISNMAGFTHRLSFAARKDWPMLTRLLDKALAVITEEERGQLLRQRVSFRLSETESPRVVQLTAQEQQWLDEHPVILAAADPAWPPMEYLDQDGELSGMVADYIALVEQRLGINIEVVPQESWSQALASVRERKVSLLTAAARTPDREKYLLYTEPYLELPAVIIVNDKAGDIYSMGDLTGKRVAVVKDYGTHDYLLRASTSMTLVPVADIRSGLYAVSYGKVDAFIANIASASHFIEKYAIQNLSVAGESGYRYRLGIASRSDWPVLNQLLQKGVASITEDERQAIYRKWIGLKSESWKPTREQLITLAVVLIVIGFGVTLVWNRQLRQKVEARTRELQVSEQEFKNLYSTALVGLYRTTIDGSEILAANPALHQQFGYDSLDEFRQEYKVTDIYVNPGRRDTLIRTLREQGKVDNFEFLGRRRDGSTRSFLLSGTLYEEQGYLEGAILDITDRKRAEEEAKTARETAEQASRAKSDFLATMSHEMRTPMNAVLGLSHLALQQEMPAQQRDYLNSIQIAARSLLGVINDVLDLSKVEAGRLELEQIEFNLDRVLEGTAVVAGHQAVSKGLNFSINVQRKVPHRVIGDPQRLGQILLNLAGNAVKFTDTGSVEIDVSLEEHLESRICLGFQVRDTGIGMSEAQAGRIFEAFTQGDSSTTRRYGGTGLGLNIANLLTRMMEGELKVHSAIGQGSTFKFTAWLEAQEAAEADRALKGNRLLLLSPTPASLRALTELLERAGADVVPVSDKERLLSTLADDESGYDLIVIDNRGDTTGRWHPIQDILPLPSRTLLLTNPDFDGCDQAWTACCQRPVTPLTLNRSVAHALGLSLHLGDEDSPGSSQADLEGCRVLLVEDNIINQQVGKELLTNRGVEVQVADNGKAALKILRERRFDLVLMDIQMPDMSGLEVTEILRSNPELSDTPIIAMTAHALQETREAALAAGMSDFLTKPIDPEIFYRVVEKYLDLSETKHPDVDRDQLSILRSLPGIDLADGMQRSCNDLSLYIKLLRDFKRYHSEDAGKLQALLELGNGQDAKRLVHSLKGTTGNIGAKRLYRICREIESTLPDSVAESAIAQLRQQLEQITTAIEQLPQGPEMVKRVPDQTERQWRELVTETAALLREGNTRAMEMVPSVLSLAADRQPDLTTKLEQLVECYRFDEAVVVLDQIDRVLEEDEQVAGP